MTSSQSYKTKTLNTEALADCGWSPSGPKRVNQGGDLQVFSSHTRESLWMPQHQRGLRGRQGPRTGPERARGARASFWAEGGRAPEISYCLKAEPPNQLRRTQLQQGLPGSSGEANAYHRRQPPPPREAGMATCLPLLSQWPTCLSRSHSLSHQCLPASPFPHERRG